MDKEPALATSFDELKKKNESHYMAAARKRLALTAVLIFLVIPALIALTVFLGSKRLYMPLSLLILVMIMAPFFMIFERRKPRAREVVLIAMMSASATSIWGRVHGLRGRCSAGDFWAFSQGLHSIESLAKMVESAILKR